MADITYLKGIDMGILIGRKREQEDLEEYCGSSKAELICIYGRRRVGKTYLVTETFSGSLAFDVTGNESKKTRDQLAAFHAALRRYGCEETRRPRDWFEAFERLRILLERPDCRRTEFGKRVVFLDEFPWLATSRSDFMAAFSDFWNSVASRCDDMAVILCGSATSWIIKNIFKDTGSMYNRVTRQMFIEPFDLRYTEEMLKVLGFDWSRETVLLCYMVFGGFPYYLAMLDRRKSLDQNINMLCLDERGQLRRETALLMEATLSESDLALKVLRALSGVKVGMEKKRLMGEVGASDGGGFKRVMDDLMQCGYVRSYVNRYAAYKPTMYQLIDPFLLFAFTFMDGRRAVHDWWSYSGSQAYYAWRGNAFEMVCALHMDQIRHALGILGVEADGFPWTSSKSSPGVQIDMVIERADRVTNVCEMKYTDDVYAMREVDARDLRRKVEVFREESGTRHALLQTIVTVSGLRHNGHAQGVASVVDLDDLFVF